MKVPTPKYLLAILLASAAFLVPVQAGNYAPEPGDLVMVYRNQFAPGKFKEALKSLEAALKKGAFEHKGVRDAYVMQDKKNSTVVAVVIWDSRREFKEWFKSSERMEMIKAIAPFHIKPTQIEEFEIFLSDDE